MFDITILEWHLQILERQSSVTEIIYVTNTENNYSNLKSLLKNCQKFRFCKDFKNWTPSKYAIFGKGLFTFGSLYSSSIWLIRFGCCSDGETPASGPDGEGCDENKLCENGPFGCCPDERTWAQGPKKQGCFECPPEVCDHILTPFLAILRPNLALFWSTLTFLFPIDMDVWLLWVDRIRVLHWPT